MSVTVHILTTEGPVRIQRIAREQTGVQSVICLDGRAHALAVSSRYDAFVRNPTGVIERATGHGAYRIDVDRTIDDGESWQLGVFIAHLLEGLEPEKSIHVFATGEIDRDLNVRHVGHVQQKLARAMASIAEFKATGEDVYVFVPASDADAAEIAGEGVEVLAVAHVDEVFAALGVPRPNEPKLPGPVPEQKNSDRGPGNRLIVISGFIVCLFIVWIGWSPVSWVLMADEGKLHALEEDISEAAGSTVGRLQQTLFTWVQGVRRPGELPPKLVGSVAVAENVARCGSADSQQELAWKAEIPEDLVICSVGIVAESVESGYVLVGRMAYWPNGLGEAGRPERTMRGSGQLNGRVWTLEFDKHPVSKSLIRLVMIWGAADPVGPQPWFSTLLSERIESASFASAKTRVERLGYAVHAVDWQRHGGSD